MLKRGKQLLRSKKGMDHEMFFTLFDIVLAFVVFLALMNFINDIKTQSIFEKNFLARDTASLINTMYASPGSVTYYYTESLTEPAKSPYYFSFTSNRASFRSLEDGKEVWYPFATNSQIPLVWSSPSPKSTFNTLVFEKTERGLSITPQQLNYGNKKS